jgi:molybdopterin-biosynthesis enzyme MoeA-like protein
LDTVEDKAVEEKVAAQQEAIMKLQERSSDALLNALEGDAELIIFTGGLGPSEDDFTIDAIGKSLGKAVVIDPVGLQKIKAIYERR